LQGRDSGGRTASIPGQGKITEIEAQGRRERQLMKRQGKLGEGIKNK